MRILPTSLQYEKDAIERNLANIQKRLKGDRKWDHTSKLIDDMLRLKEANRGAEAAIAQTAY